MKTLQWLFEGSVVFSMVYDPFQIGLSYKSFVCKMIYNKSGARNLSLETGQSGNLVFCTINMT